MAIRTEYTEAVSTGDTRNLLSPVLPTIPNAYHTYNPNNTTTDPSENIINSLGHLSLNPMYLSNTTNSFAYNSFADVLLNKEAQRRRWEGTAFDPDTPIGFLLNPIRTLVDSGLLIKNTTIDPVVGSIQLANKSKTDNFTIGKALSSGLATAGINTLVNVGNTLDIVANPVKGLVFEGPEGLIKGWTGDSQGRKQYDAADYIDNGLLAFAAEVVLDPTNLASLGAAGAAKAGIGAIAKGAGTTAVKEVTEELTQQGLKQVGKKLAQEGADKTIKATTQWALGNGEDAIKFVANKLNVGDDVAENFLKTITTDGVLDPKKATQFVDDVDKIARVGVKQYYATPKLNDEAVQNIANSVDRLGSYNFKAMGVSDVNGAVAKHIVAKALPQTVDALPSPVRLLRGLQNVDDVFTKGALIAAGVTTPLAAPVLIGIEAGKRALGKAAMKRASKATRNLAEELLDNIKSVDFTQGNAVVKVVDESGTVVKTLDTDVLKDVEQHIDRLYDASSRRMFAKVTNVDTNIAELADEISEYGASLNKIIKAKTGYESVTDFLHAVQDTYDPALKQFADKLNRYVRHANTQVDESYVYALKQAIATRAQNFDTIRRTQTENLEDLVPYQRFIELSSDVHFINDYDFECALSTATRLKEMFDDTFKVSDDSSAYIGPAFRLRKALVDAGAMQRGINEVGVSADYKPVRIKNADGVEVEGAPQLPTTSAEGFLSDLYNDTLFQLDELVDATMGLDVDAFTNKTATHQAILNLNNVLQTYETFVDDITLLSNMLDNTMVVPEVRNTIAEFVETLPDFGDVSKLMPTENIREFVNQGYVEYVFMRSKAGVLDEVLNSDALQKLLKDYDNTASNLYTTLHSEQFKDKPQTQKLIQSLEKLKAYQQLKRDLTTVFKNALVQELKFTEDNAQLYLNSVLDSLISPLEKAGAFTEGRLAKTLDRVLDSTNLNLIAKVGNESNSMDYLLYKYGLLTKGAHNADVDVANWFNLATTADSPFGELYKLKTKGKYQLILDIETTSSTKHNAEVYQIAVKLIDDQGNVVKNSDGFYKIHVSKNTKPDQSFLNKTGETVDSFIKTYQEPDADNITLWNLDEALLDIHNRFIQQAVDSGKGLPVLCGHNILDFDLDILAKSKAYRDVLEPMVNSNNVFDSYAHVSKSVFQMDEAATARVRTVLEQVLTDSKYNALTDKNTYDRIWSYSDAQNLSDFKELLASEKSSTGYNGVQTVGEWEKFGDPTLRARDTLVETIDEVPTVTEADFKKLSFEQRLIHTLALLPNFKDSTKLYNALNSLINTMDAVGFDYHRAWSKNHPELVAALDALFDEPKVKHYQKTQTKLQYVSTNQILEGADWDIKRIKYVPLSQNYTGTAPAVNVLVAEYYKRVSVDAGKHVVPKTYIQRTQPHINTIRQYANKIKTYAIDPKAYKDLKTFDDWHKFLQHNSARVNSTFIADEALDAGIVVSRPLNVKYTAMYNDLEDAIQTTRDVWNSYKNNISTKQTIRVSAEQLAQGVNIMRLLNHGVFDGAFLNIRRVRDAQFINYFDIDKILTIAKPFGYGEDKVPTSLITQLTKRSRKITEGRTRLTSRVADYLYEDAIELLKYMQANPTQFPLVQYVSDDLLKDKVTTVAFVRSYLSEFRYQQAGLLGRGSWNQIGIAASTTGKPIGVYPKGSKPFQAWKLNDEYLRQLQSDAAAEVEYLKALIATLETHVASGKPDKLLDYHSVLTVYKNMEQRLYDEANTLATKIAHYFIDYKDHHNRTFQTMLEEYQTEYKVTLNQYKKAVKRRVEFEERIPQLIEDSVKHVDSKLQLFEARRKLPQREEALSAINKILETRRSLDQTRAFLKQMPKSTTPVQPTIQTDLLAGKSLDAFERLSKLDDAYKAVQQTPIDDTAYTTKHITKDFKLNASDYEGGVERVEFTADTAAKTIRSKLDDEHIYSAYDSALAAALEPFKRLYKTVQTALKKLSAEDHIAWGRCLYNKFDASLIQEAEKTFLDPDLFVKHAPFTGGLQVFTADSSDELMSKVSRLAEDSRIVLSPPVLKRTASGGGVWCIGAALTQEEAMRQFKNIDPNVKAFYDEGARVFLDTDTPRGLGEAYTNSRQLLASRVADVGYSTGDVCTEELTQQIDMLFGPSQTPIVDTDFLKTQGWFDKVRANNMIIGDAVVHRAFNTYYSNNPLLRIQNVYEHHIIPQIDKQTLYLNLLLTRENGIDTSDIFTKLSDELLLELINNDQHNMAVVVLREARGGLEKTKGGFVVEQVRPRTVEDIKALKKVNAHCIPAEFMPSIYKAINEYELPGWAKFLQKISTGYKIGYLGSLGWPIRNILDSYGKNFVENNLSGVVPLGKDVNQLFKAETTLRKYYSIMNHCGIPVKNLDEYKVLHAMLTDSSDEFASKYLKEIPVLHKNASDAARREVQTARKLKELAERFNKLSAADKQILKKNLLPPEMFELTHKFILNGPSSGLSRKVSEHFYAGAKQVDNSVKGVDKLHQVILEDTPVKYIFDSNHIIEQSARFNRYLAELQRGSSIDTAARKTIEAHFDYSDRSLLMLYLDIIFPFMSFSFKNLTYWADRLSKMPGLARIASDLLESIMNYDSLFNPDYEAYDNFDYHYDAQDGFEPSQPWQMVNAARLYHLLAGNIVWDTGKDVLHDAGYDERMSDLYAVFKLSPSMLDAYTMLTRPLEAFEQRLLPPFAVLKDTVFGLAEGKDLQTVLGQQSLLANLPYIGASTQRWGINQTLADGFSLNHNNVLQRIKDAGLPMAVASLAGAAYVPHKDHNTWYGADFEYLTKLPQSAYSSSPYYRGGGFKPNYYATRLYADPYSTDTPTYKINKLARSSRPKDIYAKSVRSKVAHTYSDLFRNQLTFNQLKYRTLDKYYYSK
jgi:hypothetical protein